MLHSTWHNICTILGRGEHTTIAGFVTLEGIAPNETWHTTTKRILGEVKDVVYKYK